MEKKTDIKIGFACQVLAQPELKFSSCRLNNVSDKRLRQMISDNLTALEGMIDYNAKMGIEVFRIGSDLIPFATHPINTLDWKTEFAEQFERIAEKIKHAGIRVSMHPGQYSVLNAENEQVAKNAVNDIAYHAKVLDALGTDYTSKIILHIGGVYGDKAAAMARFIARFYWLNESSKARLVIENDERSYNIQEVLDIAKTLNIPCVFDNLHHLINPAQKDKTVTAWIKQCAKTWGSKDGKQKVHYSEQDETKQPGAHSKTINPQQFLSFIDTVKHIPLDIMLEVKDKNLSAIKINNVIRESYHVRYIEEEWARYKYLVMSVSQSHYDRISDLLKNKKDDVALKFYDMIDQALHMKVSASQATKAAQHVWGYFKTKANIAEKASVLVMIRQLKKDISKLPALKRKLLKLSIKYDEDYLKNSYYFVFDDI